MRRAAGRALRISYQCGVRTFRVNRRGSGFLPSAAHSLVPTTTTTPTTAAPSAARHLSTTSSRRLRHKPAAGGIEQPLRSSMYVRRASVVLVSALVGYGAWYGYKQNGNTTLTEDGGGSLARGYASQGGAQQPDGEPVTRSVLVIGADELRTGTFVGEGPISKTTDDEGRRVVEMLTPEQATQKLRRNEQSWLVDRGQGVVRYDIVQLASNDPIEDDHAEKIVEIPSKAAAGSHGNGHSDWMFWGVFDGHSGWTTSAKLRQTLISYVARELNDTYKAAKDPTPSGEAIDAAIKSGFTRLDDEIVHRSVEKVLKSHNKMVAAEMLAPALSGSCALLSFYDSRSKLLRVACTGDSRAVLGRRSADGSGRWTATPLSVDQTGSNPDEEARMRRLHPGEQHVIRNGRVLGGLEPTRAFGDASYKWSRDVAERLRGQYFGRSVSSLLKTPPYVTAEPVVTTTRVEPEKGDFVVMATDGLWEMLTNEEVVGLVGKWIETQQQTTGGASANSQLNSVWSRLFSSAGGGKGNAALPVDKTNGGSGGGGGYDGQKTPVRLQQWGISPDDDRFLVRDKNAATHLIRNALGGKNEEQVSALLTLPAPISRRYRDDLTVQVIFFGQPQQGEAAATTTTGEVVLNGEATAGGKVAKAKL